MVALVGVTVAGFAGGAYCVGVNIDSDLRFLEPRRAPTFDDALITYSIEYALHSRDTNDVIFVGDSTCRFGVDPIQFEKLTGLRAYNLGGVGFLGPMGILLPARAYLAKHPRPQIIVACMTPFVFQVGAEQLAKRNAMPGRYAANYGPEVPGAIPWQNSLAYFVKRGAVAAGQAVWGLLDSASPDVRDMPITTVKATYRTFQRELDRLHGHWVPAQAHGKVAEGARKDPSWPGQPVKVDPDWDRALRELAELCHEQGIPFLIRLTPTTNALAKTKDLKGIADWARDLQRSCPGVTVEDPIILWYAPELHWDCNHLNAQGAATFTSLVAKEVKAALGSDKRAKTAKTAR
jgi:hypothetical protein